jgi:hypothetical protein
MGFAKFWKNEVRDFLATVPKQAAEKWSPPVAVRR